MTDKRESFADKMERAHAALLKDLKELGDAARAPQIQNAGAWRRRLATIQSDVAKHFRYEEQNGYMTEVLKRKPNQERVVEQLLAEHQKLLLALTQLGMELDKAGLPDGAWLAKIQAWIGDVRKHEFSENDLVQDAFNLDISAED